MTATIIKFPKHSGPPIRCVDSDAILSELKAAAEILRIATERPEKAAEAVAVVRNGLGRVEDALAGMNGGLL